MGRQKMIAASVLRKGANYLMLVKDNQPKLVDAFVQAFPVGELLDFEGVVNVRRKNCGRQETQHHIIIEFTKKFQKLNYEWSS
jgi:hypothetical protein